MDKQRDALLCDIDRWRHNDHMRSSQGPGGESFEDVFDAMQEDKYWINFFVRPCCPPPGKRDAIKSLDKRRDEVRSHADYTDEQKEQLLAIIDERRNGTWPRPSARASPSSDPTPLPRRVPLEHI